MLTQWLLRLHFSLMELQRTPSKNPNKVMWRSKWLPSHNQETELSRYYFNGINVTAFRCTMWLKCPFYHCLLGFAAWRLLISTAEKRFVIVYFPTCEFLRGVKSKKIHVKDKIVYTILLKLLNKGLLYQKVAKRFQVLLQLEVNRTHLKTFSKKTTLLRYRMGHQLHWWW